MKNILKLLLIQLGLTGLIFSLNATDPYEYLSGISEDTTITPDMELSEKNKACRKFALEYHPDRHQTDKARYEKLFININSACDAIKEDKKDFKLPYEFVDEQLKTMADLPGFREHLSQVAEELKRNFEPLFAEAKRKNQRMPLEALQEFHELWDKPIGSDTSLRVGTFLIILNAPGLDFFIEHNLIDPTKPITINTSTITPDQLAAKAGHFDLAYKFRKHAAEQQKQKTNQPQSESPKQETPKSKPATPEPSTETAPTTIVDTDNVSDIQIGGAVKLTISTDPSKPYQAALYGPKGVLKDYEMRAENNLLVIKPKHNIITSALEISASINVPTINSLDISGSVSGSVLFNKIPKKHLSLFLSGSANLTVLDIQTKKVQISASGSGTVKITGSTKELDISASGAVHIDAQKLATHSAHISASGAGTMQLFVDKHLSGQCSGASNITNFGRAAADISTSGACNIQGNVKKNKKDKSKRWKWDL